VDKQAIVYARFSPRPDASECDSITKQVERCQAYCDHKGYFIRHVHVDPNASGGTLERRGLRHALANLEKDWVLIVDRSDRLARDMLVSITIKQIIKEAGATIEYADGSPEEITPEGKLFQGILTLIAAYERDRIRLRTKLGLERKRRACQKISKIPPIGWEDDPVHIGSLRLNETEQDAIVYACRLKGEGKRSSFEIAELLNLSFGRSSCRGKPWNDRTVRRIIKRHMHWAYPLQLDLRPMHP